MRAMEPLPEIGERTSLRELLQRHPKAIHVLIERDVPISCAGGSIADAARACGMAASTLLAELLTHAGDDDSGTGVRPDDPSRPQPDSEVVEFPGGHRGLAPVPKPAQVDESAWHAVPLETTLELLGTDPTTGLSSREARRRRAWFGPNTLQLAKSNRKRKPWWRSIRWGAPAWSDRHWRWEE